MGGYILRIGVFQFEDVKNGTKQFGHWKPKKCDELNDVFYLIYVYILYV